MAAKEIADLARSTNITDENAVEALSDAIGARSAQRREAGENVDMERALRVCAHETHRAAVGLARSFEDVSKDAAQIADSMRAGQSVHRGTLGRLPAPQHDAGHYSATFAAWESTVDLFGAVADLVRATPEEKAEALAKREAAKAPPPKKSRKRAA